MELQFHPFSFSRLDGRASQNLYLYQAGRLVSFLVLNSFLALRIFNANLSLVTCVHYVFIFHDYSV
jgi:hypothetical protein